LSNSYFQFKQFTIHQDQCAMKVTTDACLFGAWVAERVGRRESLVRSREPLLVSRESGVGSRKSGGRRREAGARNILEIGTGTGLLALMLAQKTDAVVDTIEIDKDAFEQGKENISVSPWKDRINIYHADANKVSFRSEYDIIISNPPFYENELKSPDEKKNLAHHGGFRLIELLEIISFNLDASGQFYILFPAKRVMEYGMLISKFELHVS